jgi:AAA+ ATPase superfamily predicted ATPase
MFVGRQKELQVLEEEYQKDDFRLTVLYGRRRVGKTTLIKKHISSKPYVYFLVTLEALPIVVQRFQNLVARFLQDDLLETIELKSFEQIFFQKADLRRICWRSKKKRRCCPGGYVWMTNGYLTSAL